MPCFLDLPFSVRSIMLQTGSTASLFDFFGQSQASIVLKAWDINAAIK